MADITLSVPPAVTNRVLDAISTRYGYNPAVDGTKAAFVKKWIIKQVMDAVREHEVNTAAATAATTAGTSVTTDIVIT